MRGRHRSLEAAERINIGGVSAPVILTMIGSILLDVAVGGDVVQDPAQVIFIISKNPYNTKPTVILIFSTPSHCSFRTQAGSF